MLQIAKVCDSSCSCGYCVGAGSLNCEGVTLATIRFADVMHIYRTKLRHHCVTHQMQSCISCSCSHVHRFTITTVELSLFRYAHITFTHLFITHTHTHIYIYIYIGVCSSTSSRNTDIIIALVVIAFGIGKQLFSFYKYSMN